MSYQVLARKWRPRNFASLVGQEHVVRALTHALEQNRLHHAIVLDMRLGEPAEIAELRAAERLHPGPRR